MPNVKHDDSEVSRALADDNVPEDLALPGETLDEDEQLRLEINLDRSLWNQCPD